MDTPVGKRVGKMWYSTVTLTLLMSSVNFDILYVVKGDVLMQ